MKLNRILFAAAALAVASCTLPREEISVELGEPTAVELNVEIPVAGTRATTGTDSENGGLTNVDWGAYDLRYTIEIYDATGNALAFSDVYYDTASYNGYSNSISLTKGRTYQLYIWADFVTTQGHDLHYNTSDLRSISLLDPNNYTVNDESRDAYVYYGTFDVGSGANAINAELKRPFAKLRLVTTDANSLSFDQKIGSIEVSYVSGTKVPSSFAPATNALGDEITVTDVTAPVTAYANEAVGGAEEGNCTLLTDYIFAPATGQGSVEVALSVYDTTGALIYTIPTKLIPYSRNQRTTVEGPALTGSANLTVTVDGDITEITGGNMSF